MRGPAWLFGAAAALLAGVVYTGCSEEVSPVTATSGGSSTTAAGTGTGGGTASSSSSSSGTGGGPVVCGAGELECGGACVNPDTDPLNCGLCGSACAPMEVCDLGL